VGDGARHPPRLRLDGRRILAQRVSTSALLSAVAAAVTIALVPSTPAAAAEIGPLQIINYNSGLCLDVKERSTSNGALFASGPAAASQTSCGGFTSSRQETATSSIYSRSA
jgi:hypothetical protein